MRVRCSVRVRFIGNCASCGAEEGPRGERASRRHRARPNAVTVDAASPPTATTVGASPGFSAPSHVGPPCPSACDNFAYSPEELDGADDSTDDSDVTAVPSEQAPASAASGHETASVTPATATDDVEDVSHLSGTEASTPRRSALAVNAPTPQQQRGTRSSQYVNYDFSSVLSGPTLARAPSAASLYSSACGGSAVDSPGSSRQPSLGASSRQTSLGAASPPRPRSPGRQAYPNPLTGPAE